jgi:hypothetical protein
MENQREQQQRRQPRQQQQGYPLGYLVDELTPREVTHYLDLFDPINRQFFESRVPQERRVILIDTSTMDASAYDAALISGTLQPAGYGLRPGYMIKPPPGPALLINDVDVETIMERARAAQDLPSSGPDIAEPEESIYVRDPTPSCQILPPGSAYDNVFDFTDFDIDREEFEREVPEQRRVVLRSGSSTLAYDALQLLRATKGIASTSDQPLNRRTYVILTATGSCIIDRNAYVDLVQRASSGTLQPTFGNIRDTQSQGEEEEQEEEQDEEDEYEQEQSDETIGARHLAPPLLPAISSIRQSPRPTLPRLDYPRGRVVHRPLSPAQPRRVLPNLRLPTLSDQQQQLEPQGPAGLGIRRRIDEAARQARRGGLVRLIGQPDFIEIMQTPLAGDALAQALVDDFVRSASAAPTNEQQQQRQQSQNAVDAALPIVLTSLAVQSLGVAPLSESIEAKIISGLAERGALGDVSRLVRSGFAPSDNVIIRSVLTQLTRPRADHQTAVAILDALPMRDLANYRRVLAAAARVGSPTVARYVVESILRNRPLSRSEALNLAQIANEARQGPPRAPSSEAGQRAVESLFLSLADSGAASRPTQPPFFLLP